MKKISFLAKMNKEKKLRLVEPSEEVKKAYIQRSEESLSSAKALLQIGHLRDSVSLSYYAMYHCLLALLFRSGIKCENHAAAIIMLESVFGINSRKISDAKKERIDKQYYVDFDISREETADTIKAAEEFISDVSAFIENLKEQDIEQYRRKLLDLAG